MAQLKEGTTIGGVDILHILDLLDIELGRNENGNWVRWNNGLQMCWIVKPSWPGAVVDTAWGNIYRSSTQLTWSYPKNFIDNPFLAGGGSGSVSVVFSGSTGRSNTESMVFRTERANASTTDPDIWLVAIGWWKTPEDPAEWSEE